MVDTESAWLVKSEPFKYPWEKLLADERTSWDGVRNYEARNNLRAMKKGELVLFYHSNEGKEIVGLAKVVKEAYQDPTTEEDWSVVDVSPVVTLSKPVTLAALKAHPTLKEMAVVKRSRISVTKVTKEELATVLELASTKLPKKR
jgi:predicted RNA-binding protein with PUA-like domain